MPPNFRILELSHFRTSVACLRPIAYCLCLLALPLTAEVFWRLPKQADTILRQMDGSRVYTTDVLLNGEPGTLAAYAFGEPAPRVSANLSRRLGLPAPTPAGGAFFSHAEKNRLHRFFVLPSPANNDTCVVLAFDQSLRAFARARQEPPAWPDGLPALNATPLFSAVCALTRTSFVTADSPASPEAAADEAAQTLRGAGWAEALPSAATFKLFVSGRKQCALFASRNPQTGQTTISLLQREGATP